MAKHCEELAEALAAMIPADVEAAKKRRHQANAAGAAKRPTQNFELDDFVLVLARGHRNKLQMRWLGPRRVVDTVNDLSMWSIMS